MDRGIWPTPTAFDSTTCTKGEQAVYKDKNRRAMGGNGGPSRNLREVVMLPTASANDWKGSSKPGQRRGQLTDPAMGVIEAGGSLNPNWVEWLMGWPLGWTSTEPIPESTWAAWQRAFRSDPIASDASGTDRFRLQ